MHNPEQSVPHPEVDGVALYDAGAASIAASLDTSVLSGPTFALSAGSGETT